MRRVQKSEWRPVPLQSDTDQRVTWAPSLDGTTTCGLVFVNSALHDSEGWPKAHQQDVECIPAGTSQQSHQYSLQKTVDVTYQTGSFLPAYRCHEQRPEANPRPPELYRPHPMFLPPHRYVPPPAPPPTPSSPDLSRPPPFLPLHAPRAVCSQPTDRISPVPGPVSLSFCGESSNVLYPALESRPPPARSGQFRSVLPVPQFPHAVSATGSSHPGFHAVRLRRIGDLQHQRRLEITGDMHHQHQLQNVGDMHHQHQLQSVGDMHHQQQLQNVGDMHHQQQLQNVGDMHHQQQLQNVGDMHHQQQLQNVGDMHHQQQLQNVGDMHLQQRLQRFGDMHQQQLHSIGNMYNQQRLQNVGRQQLHNVGGMSQQQRQMEIVRFPPPTAHGHAAWGSRAIVEETYRRLAIVHQQQTMLPVAQVSVYSARAQTSVVASPEQCSGSWGIGGDPQLLARQGPPPVVTAPDATAYHSIRLGLAPLLTSPAHPHRWSPAVPVPVVDEFEETHCSSPPKIMALSSDWKFGDSCDVSRRLDMEDTAVNPWMKWSTDVDLENSPVFTQHLNTVDRKDEDLSTGCDPHSVQNTRLRLICPSPCAPEGSRDDPQTTRTCDRPPGIDFETVSTPVVTTEVPLSVCDDDTDEEGGGGSATDLQWQQGFSCTALGCSSSAVKIEQPVDINCNTIDINANDVTTVDREALRDGYRTIVDREVQRDGYRATVGGDVEGGSDIIAVDIEDQGDSDLTNVVGEAERDNAGNAVDGEVQGDNEKTVKRKKPRVGPPQPKNAVTALNEMCPGSKYQLQQDGPTHAPVFTATVQVNGVDYVGSGRSKRHAKLEAAQAALGSFIQFKDTHLQQQLQQAQPPADFTADEDAASMETCDSGGVQRMASKTLTPADKNPVQLLNELQPGLQYVLEEESGEPHSKTFSMSVIVNDVKYDGIGPSKRLGKAAAAKAVLSQLYNYSFLNYTSSMPDSAYSSCTDISDHMTFPQSVADKISKLVNDRFQQLMASRPSHSRRKVLAGMVMTCGPQLDSDVTLISLSTGTKCISGERMSEQGLSINDCHAEVVTRRCLIEYLYSQLMLLQSSDTAAESIFEPRQEGRGYRLKKDIQFHLYISTAPCGDARIFSPHEALSLSESSDKHPNRRARGQLRTKIESGEGTIPVKIGNEIQTWDGVLQGQRLLTMSCSDKIARWNVVGVQGALLALFIEPIYLSSVVLGSLFHPSHLVRAIVGRVERTLHGLPAPYRLHTPLVAATSCSEQRQPGKAPNYCISWTHGQDGAEVVNAMTGKDENGAAPRLCKSIMYERFLRLFGRLRSIQELPTVLPTQYGQVKRLNTAYATALQCLRRAFSAADLGQWVQKPVEQDMFGLDD